MGRSWWVASLLGMLAGCAAADAEAQSPGLTAFRSEGELKQFLERVKQAQQARERAAPTVMYDLAPAPALAMMAPEANAAQAPGITNNQISGVDEGDIVKAKGDLLIVLRRGRLFTISTAGGKLEPRSAIDAYPPGADARGDWYDEMLITGDWVVVIGYSYSRGGTQLTRFRLSPDGKLGYVDAYAFRSFDYYSSRNYASRLIGDRLILYAPLPILVADGLFGPALGRWDDHGRRMSTFKPLSVAARTFVPDRLKRGDLSAIDTVHSVTDCTLTAPVLRCKGTAVLGSSSRSFFVSQDAVFVWTGAETEGWRRPPSPGALVYRLPLDGSRPQAVAARGQPIDQFSFYPDQKRDALQVVVAEGGGGDAMFRPERPRERLALATIPMRLFGTGNLTVPARNYQPLAGVTDRWSFQNRFVSDHLLYGEPSAGRFGMLHILSLADRQSTDVTLSHGVDRLDAIGPDAIAIGAGEKFLGFSAIALGGPRPTLAAAFRLPDAGESESRSHAFFFRPERSDASGASGLLGLPVGRMMQGGHGFMPAAAVLFLRRDGRALSRIGELASAATGERDDRCQASCVDWYGNARPIFLGDRVFALLGYELVEGRVGAKRIEELGRTDFGAAATRLAGR